MRTVDVARKAGLTYRQIDYWLRKLGSSDVGSGFERDIPPDLAQDIIELARLRREADERIARKIEEMFRKEYSRPLRSLGRPQSSHRAGA